MLQTVDVAAILEEAETADVVSATTAACGLSCFSSSAADVAIPLVTADAATTAVCGLSCYSSSAADAATPLTMDATAANPNKQINEGPAGGRSF